MRRILLIAALGALSVPAQQPHAECALFGPRGGELRGAQLEAERRGQWSRWNNAIVPRLGAVKGSSRRATGERGLIDTHIFRALEDAGVAPAALSTDYEFIRRVSLDLTGRVPTAERITQFVASAAAANQRPGLIDELLETPEWVDKWTMFYGDLFKNVADNANVTRYPDGRNAFHAYIKSSLAANKPYDVMVREMIAATGTDSYRQGELNWIVGGVMAGTPRRQQDNYDQMAANASEQFLGLAHFTCVLCHDGRRHLDNINLWGSSAVRLEGYQFASFFARDTPRRVPVGAQANPYYWSIIDGAFNNDYPLDRGAGNRPPRVPIGSITNVPPVYPFSGATPEADEPYRTALARALTADIQFARATVNYIWQHFFTRGLVEPVNQFDLARLDPDNPPPEPWTLQATHPRLLNELAAAFVENGYDLKWLMRTIANSEAYQLSARYEGEWNPAWETLFARKLVRRLWAEEIHDAIVQTSGIPASYTVRDQIRGPMLLTSAMQLPETAAAGMPSRQVATFLDSFFRGNRQDDPRRSDASAPQALSLMNDSLVMSRTNIRAGLLALLIAKTDEELVAELFLNVLSRPPSDAERAQSLEYLAAADASPLERGRKAEDLMWALYQKVDFLYNY